MRHVISGSTFHSTHSMFGSAWIRAWRSSMNASSFAASSPSAEIVRKLTPPSSSSRRLSACVDASSCGINARMSLSTRRRWQKNAPSNVSAVAISTVAPRRCMTHWARRP